MAMVADRLLFHLKARSVSGWTESLDRMGEPTALGYRFQQSKE